MPTEKNRAKPQAASRKPQAASRKPVTPAMPVLKAQDGFSPSALSTR
ncbi:hypothetical protein [Polaromonas eurypsychrophila]|nr:hypothetical protein [Polaromonas eurypsychrophila]